jgi:lipopolysaccharide transport system ATP-binding protein
MPNTVISVENLTKSYQLGVIGTGTFRGDVQRWWAKLRGQPDPFLKIGQADHSNRQGETLWALKDINFTVQQGEALGIIGRNGAGKSTLLKILSRVTAPTSGQVRIKGRIASLLEVGTGFHPELTGRENIYLNGAILGMNRAEVTRKFDEIVDFSGVEQFIDTPVKRYSSGMYVRLAFAVAAHLEPEILVVDEVLAVGDAEFQNKCLGKMSDVAHEGRTVLFVSHNMAAVENLCTHAYLLNRGQIIYSGTQTDTILKYHEMVSPKKISLSENTDRTGSGVLRFTHIEFRDVNGRVIDFVQSGQTVDVFLYYTASSQYIGGQVHVGLIFSTQMGVQVFSQTTRIMKSEFNQVPRQGAFVCRIPRIPLPASTYSIKCGIRVNEAVSDDVNSAILLTIVEADFFGTGVIPNANQGVCLVDGKWRLETINQEG